MLKISDSLKSIVDGNSFIKFGLYNRLLNLSKLAVFIKPLVETRVKKEVSLNALLMGLSRLQNEKMKEVPSIDRFSIIDMTVNSDLCSMSFFANQTALENMNKVHTEIQKRKGYITLNQGTTEISIIVNESMVGTVLKLMKDKPKSNKYDLASIGLRFDSGYNDTPGFLHYVMQQIALQGISIYEISSTYTELILYIEERNMKLSFDTLYNCFYIKNNCHK